MSDDPMLDKSALRAELRAARTTFARGRAPLAPPPEWYALLRTGLTVASYMPMAGEADPLLLARAASDTGAAIALPHVVGRDRPVRFLAWQDEEALHSGAFGLLQPHHEAPELRPDIVLTPLVGFDRTGNRLGQGAGHYDRAFAALPHARRIGVAWGVQEVAALPADAWDVPLHFIVTEREWIVCLCPNNFPAGASPSACSRSWR